MPPLGIDFTGRFQSEARSLSRDQCAQLEEVLDRLAAAFGQPHRHTGLGIRRLQGNYFEVRIGRDLRVVFTLEGRTAILRTIGNHD